MPTPRREGRHILDSTGYHSRTIPAKDFEESVRNHCWIRRETLAEVLVIGQCLRDARPNPVLGPGTRVTSVGAYWQDYYGVTERPACHVMHTLMLFDDHYPDVLLLNASYQHRIIRAFARCTLQSKVVNAIDKLIDEDYGREAQLGAMKRVLQGDSPTEGYRDYARRMKEGTSLLLQLLYDSWKNPRFSEIIQAGSGREEAAFDGEAFADMLESDGARALKIYLEEFDKEPVNLNSAKLQKEIETENWFASAPPGGAEPQE